MGRHVTTPYKTPESIRERARKYYWAHREHILAQRKLYAEANPAKVKNTNARARELYGVKYRLARRAKQYGITEDRARELLEETVCEICGWEGKMHFDHDHTAGAFRGLLCTKCNMGIGLFSEDITKLEAAIAYIRKHKCV